MDITFTIQQISISHLLYIDDLKLFARSRQHLASLINNVRKFSNDVHMNFGFEKCKAVEIFRGKVMRTEGFSFNEGLLEVLDEEESYKYFRSTPNTWNTTLRDEKKY